ncbi:transglycosylase SLT domain-containing protein [Pseudohalioglobus sediminis]|uniref:transglycosylase SLT domain-containing protein n=1 Tax=Pseudohalioglobus sediminis TaxID=2606449 RepID=UPI001CB7231F|nr:transglycosylase SLT domain-containing protein [Pseudohalioglobus sediminis]
MTRLALLVIALLLAGCTTSPPTNVENICAIFEEKRGWYDDAADARDNWGSPIPVAMAIMHQESRFVAKARPPRKKIFGFIPGPRPSDAYGYSQAKKSTWKEYKRGAGNYGADRDDFADAIDFIGWYNHRSNRRNGISKQDTYRLYLAYHEGNGGYSRGSYRNKDWLKQVARKVERRAGSYRQQLHGCEASLKKRGWFFGW